MIWRLTVWLHLLLFCFFRVDTEFMIRFSPCIPFPWGLHAQITRPMEIQVASTCLTGENFGRTEISCCPPPHTGVSLLCFPLLCSPPEFSKVAASRTPSTIMF